MQTFPKKRVEILIERALLKRLVGELGGAGTFGYSVVPLAAGQGQSGQWASEGQIGGAAGMFAVWCIVDAAALDLVLQVVFTVVSRQIGIVSVSDVQVVRPERF
jgi:hypothetical protein